MSAPRTRRLAADYESVRGQFSGHPHVHVEPLGPQWPPEAYRVIYRVRGLRLDGSQPVAANEHVVEIQLPLGYPRDKPVVLALTPVFHPNIKEQYCIQDYWAAGQTLVDTIAKIAEMLQYRVYNPRSPLNALAARWTVENEHLFPLGNVTLSAAEVPITLGGRAVPAPEPQPEPEPQAPEPEAPVALALPSAAEDHEDDLVISLRRGA